MEVHFGPNSVDEPNLLYKLQRSIKVFNTNDSLPNRGYNLVASSSKYGLVFVAVPDGTLTVYYLSELINRECQPKHLRVQLQEKPTHIAMNCDGELLAVTGGQILCFYKIADFQNLNLSPLASIKTGVSPSTYVSALQWNPCIPDSIAIVYFDSTLIAYIVSSGQLKKVPSKARCISWSPKGKQLVTGNVDGTLNQYKPDLTIAKTGPAPNLFEGQTPEAIAIYWISTFQFAVVYKPATDDFRPAVTIINTPKTGQPSCITYEDICFSTMGRGASRPWYYYLLGLTQWNFIMGSSSNSMEMGTLCSEDGINWVQWCQTDEARPELPLTNKIIENYPVGIAIDTCAIHQLPWGETETLPHMPLLHVLSQNGLLTTFNIVNLKNPSVQVCSPPKLLTLPSQAMISEIPGQAAAVHKPVAAPVPAFAPTPKVEPQQQPTPFQAPTAIQSAPQIVSASVSATIKIPSFTTQPNLTIGTGPAVKVKEEKPIFVPETIPTVVSQPQPESSLLPQPKPQQQTVLNEQPATQQTEESAALKAEHDRLTKMKLNEELKSILIKEVNEFQTELYDFMVKTRETQARLQRDIDAITNNFNSMTLDTKQLKKECSMEELKGALVQLKLELVRACAVVAEARTHANAKDLPQWTQADPLTIKSVASVKKLAYYVQNQLEQAQRALEYKWNEYASRNPEFNKPGKYMIRPILDDVYQPLVKQQEILGRQESVLRTLKNALKECDIGPVFKSTSLLRSTPFRNKDPLSKLTKNILNMSIDNETKQKRTSLNNQKLEALREVLSKHKTVKIKPVSVELREHLATMRKNYEKSLLEMAKQSQVNTESQVPQVKPAPPPVKAGPIYQPEPVKSLAPQVFQQPAFTPVSNVKQTTSELANVARALFTDELKQEPPMPQTGQWPFMPKPFALSANVNEPTVDTKSVLKDILTNKQANLKDKNNDNLFMGLNICSPTAFAQSSAPTPSSAPSAVFTSNPIADLKNMSNKFPPQPFAVETKSALNAKSTSKPSVSNVPNVKSSETGEPEESIEVSKALDFKPNDKPIINLFGTKPTPVAPTKTSEEQKVEGRITIKPLSKLTDKTKENIPDKGSEHVVMPVSKASEKKEVLKKASENVPTSVPKASEKKEVLKPLNTQTANKSLFGVVSSSETVDVSAVISKDPKLLELKSEVKIASSKPSDTGEATAGPASIFSSANASISVSKPLSAFSPTSTTTKTEKPSKPTESESKQAVSITTSASSIFGAAVASQPKTTSSIFSSSSASIFSSTSNTPKSVFGTTSSSIFSGSKTTLETVTTASAFDQTSTTQSAFSSTAASVFASASSAQPTSPKATSFVAATTTAASIFGSVPALVTSTFGSTTPTSAFGTETTSTPSFGTTTSSVFGTATSSNAASVFGATTTAGATPVFGATPTTQASVFGSTEAASSAFTPTTTSIFGTATTQASVFGQAASASAFGATTQASIFGGTVAQPSVFGAPSTQASVFGSPTPTTQASVFGTPTETTQASIFGTPTAITQASVFGTPTQASQSVFGTPTQTTQASIFGQTETTQGGLFGGGEANLFAAASISTTSAPTPSSGGNIFGGSQSGSVFGGGSNNVFGGKSSFGQSNQTAANIFGGSASFGQQPATNFWGSGGSSTGSAFGSSGFGQTATTQSSSLFGGTTGGSFSQPSSGAFGSPAQPSAFGSPQQQQSSAFGGSPVFGSKPSFGQSAGFGGSATSGGFGSSASFGGFSAGTGFGSTQFGGGASFGAGSATGGGFGSPTQSNATFESLATQNTLTFGNLAQQSATAQPAAPAFNNSSFTGWRG